MNKERIDNLLADIRVLEKLVSGMREEDFYMVSSFTQSFEQAHKVLVDIHSLEIERLETLRRQMEEHQKIIRSISSLKPATMPQPVPEPTPAPIAKEPKKEEVKVEEKPVVVIEEPQKTEEPAHRPKEVPVPPVVAPSFLPVQEKDIVAEKKTTVFLSEILEKKSLSDFRKAFSLNDRFRFKRELFNGDEAMMNKAISELNDVQSYDDSISYLRSELNWNTEDEAVGDFIKLLEKRFL